MGLDKRRHGAAWDRGGGFGATLERSVLGVTVKVTKLTSQAADRAQDQKQSCRGGLLTTQDIVSVTTDQVHLQFRIRVHIHARGSASCSVKLVRTEAF